MAQGEDSNGKRRETMRVMIRLSESKWNRERENIKETSIQTDRQRQRKLNEQFHE